MNIEMIVEKINEKKAKYDALIEQVEKIDSMERLLDVIGTCEKVYGFFDTMFDFEMWYRDLLMKKIPCVSFVKINILNMRERNYEISLYYKEVVLSVSRDDLTDVRVRRNHDILQGSENATCNPQEIFEYWVSQFPNSEFSIKDAPELKNMLGEKFNLRLT